MNPRTPSIVVVGSVNMDLMLQCPHLPMPGETVLGSTFQHAPGGKGANQAVAAARLGAAVTLIACIGNDAYGAEAREALRVDNIDMASVHTADGVATGIAMITSDDSGENCIALAPGANLCLAPHHLDESRALFAIADMVLCQLEVPLATVRHAVSMARHHKIPLVLNPAPAQMLEPEDLAGLDTLVLNTVEASMLSGRPVHTQNQVMEAAHVLKAAGVRTVIITMGSAGAVALDDDGPQHFPAPQVHAIDTTGAGDTFVGAYATARAQGYNLPQAMEFAQQAAAYSVTRRGAQASMPYRAALREVPALSAEAV